MRDRVLSVCSYMQMGSSFKEPITLNDTNFWKYEWSDLPKVSESGEEIKYTVQEVEIPGKVIGIDYIPDYDYKYDDNSGVGVFHGYKH